jgi:hypothetical protein
LKSLPGRGDHFFCILFSGTITHLHFALASAKSKR